MDKPITNLEDMLPSIQGDIEAAVDWLHTSFGDDFEKADRYFNGAVDIEAEEGRSAAVATTVRDSIRNMRPSVLRVFCSNRYAIVSYKPSSVALAPVVEQQQIYVHQLFWQNNGYRVLYDAIDETFKHKFAPVKTYWEPNAPPEYVEITGLTLDEVLALDEMPDVDVLQVAVTDDDAEYGDEPKKTTVKALEKQQQRDRAKQVNSLSVGNGGTKAGDVPMPTPEDEDELKLYTVRCERKLRNGRIRLEAIPYGEFFISKDARNTAEAKVHGHRRSVTVAEAISMGLEHDDWFELDDLNPEVDEVSAQATERRGYRPDKQEERGDVMAHQFLLTECYVYADLEDAGFEQVYCLYLGGTAYELLDYHRESETPIDIICHDPRAFTVIGSSISDLTVASQDVNTSMLRGIIDNVHMSNNPRLAGNPSMVNFDDLMNWSIAHPIRLKGQGTAVQVITTPSNVQSALPVLQYLDADGQNKVGVTKAAQGLDPDAMQSTDKNAVQNTIQLSQGQVELAVRNIIETGLISIFRKLLRLSIQHLDRNQVIQTRGFAVPVDQLYFRPELAAEPEVGLGTTSETQRLTGLAATLAQQMTIMTQLGVNNPFVTMSHIYNTLADLTTAQGLPNVSRYFNEVTPEVEAAFAKQQQEAQAKAAAAAKGQQMDPAMALIKTEEMKTGVDHLKLMVQMRDKALDRQLKAIELDAQDDLKRDQMAQDRQIKASEIVGKFAVQVDQNDIKHEQNADRAKQASDSLSVGTEKEDAKMDEAAKGAGQ